MLESLEPTAQADETLIRYKNKQIFRQCLAQQTTVMHSARVACSPCYQAVLEPGRARKQSASVAF